MGDGAYRPPPSNRGRNDVRGAVVATLAKIRIPLAIGAFGRHRPRATRLYNLEGNGITDGRKLPKERKRKCLNSGPHRGTPKLFENGLLLRPVLAWRGPWKTPKRTKRSRKSDSLPPTAKSHAAPIQTFQAPSTRFGRSKRRPEWITS